MTVQPSTEPSALAASLTRFLQINPTARLDEEGERPVVETPWNDDSLAIEIDPGNVALLEALNNVILPPTLTAIYHTDTSYLEFIFSVRPNDDHLWKRQFDFTYRGATYSCKYAASSERLLAIAAACTPRKPMSPTDHRNLRVFRDFAKPNDLPSRLRAFFNGRSPMSFFLGPIEVHSSDQVHDLARHLNFHMFYFDRETPQVIIHSPQASQPAIFEQPTPAPPPFPSSVLASPIDDHILDLLGGAQQTTGRLAFLYYYQILEYAAFYYFEESVRHEISKILRRPDVLSSIDICLPLIIDELVEYRQPDEQKLAAVIQRAADPFRVWQVIASYISQFSEPIEFDGGFQQPTLAREGWGPDDFSAAWIPKLPDALRKVRNALVHSREYRLGHTIAPTRDNLERLQPWVRLIEEVASQVALYRSA
jgi:hypothetical protein